MKTTHHNFNTLTPEIEDRIDRLLAQMSLEEKIGQTVQVHINEDNQEEMTNRIRRGLVGSVLTIYGVENINKLQKLAVEETRLGIPLIVGNDVIHGYRTIFPIPLAESCTWDPNLVEEAARIAAEEATANGVNWNFAPMVDITRDPRWGRIAEGSGEDPYLGSEMARARVRGFQAANLKSGRKMVACPKHYVAYGWAESGKDYNTTDLSERTLRDVILPPFKAAFEAGAGTSMSAFNDLNGIPASANPFTLRQILREEWRFHGFVVSDWNSIGELVPHGLAADLKEAGRRAFLAGVDMDMVSEAYHTHLADLVRKGVVPLSLLETSVRAILRVKFLLGLFEEPFTDEAQAESSILQPEYLDKALEVARSSLVLLKNDDHLLPLKGGQNIALLGPLADDHHEILGCWHCIGRDEDTESVLDGMKAVFGEANLNFVPGCDLTGLTEPDFAPAIEAAQKADVAVLVLGEGESMSGEAHSRAHLGLPGHQQALLEAVFATGTPVVVVLMSGRPLVIPWMAETVPAILAAWHGGLRAGRAIAEVLAGHFNPSGKLTASWPRAEGQIPLYYYHKNTGRPASGEGTTQFDDPFRSNYIDEANTPQFPFGYGLSYTTFGYRDLHIENPVLKVDDTLIVSAVITNTGQRTGDEIVQLYVRDLVGEVTRPVKELKGFQKITLKPGESQRVRFEIPAQRLGFHGLDMRYKTEPGAFKVWVGPNASEGLEGDFAII